MPKSPNIPSSVKVNGYTIRVECTDLVKDQGMDKVGYLLMAQSIIRIDRNISEQVQDQTLVHEIMEAIDSANDLGLNHTQTSVIAEAFYQVIKDNKLDFSTGKE